MTMSIQCTMLCTNRGMENVMQSIIWGSANGTTLFGCSMTSLTAIPLSHINNVDLYHYVH